MTMQRHVPFDSAVNFRDLGGYATSDGRHVKWQRLFRCGHMANLSDADMDRLSAPRRRGDLRLSLVR